MCESLNNLARFSIKEVCIAKLSINQYLFAIIQQFIIYYKYLTMNLSFHLYLLFIIYSDIHCKPPRIEVSLYRIQFDQFYIVLKEQKHINKLKK